MSQQEPTALSDPQAYLSLRKFNRRLKKCRRTGLPVTFCDIGEPNGIPVLWILPSGCSRWVAVTQDPLAKLYGIRLVALDRPGVGGTPMVPLHDRIRMSCEMIESVLEYIDLKINHMLVSSAGIYYALHLLVRHPNIFPAGLSRPPWLYLVAPWSPLLDADHPDYYSSYFSWVPDSLITTQHYTIPTLVKVAKSATSWWNFASQATSSGLGSVKSMFVDAGPVAPLQDTPAPSEEKGRLWGRCPCCVSCLMTDYLYAENFEGIGQDHILCLNRGPDDTGPKYIERLVDHVAAAVQLAQNAGGKEQNVNFPLDVQVWWGWKDGMVPRKGQHWFNKVMSARPDAIKLTVHDVPEGDHNNLMAKIDGAYQVYDMIKERGK